MSTTTLAGRLAALLLVGLALAPAPTAQPDDRSQLPSLTPAVFESRGVIAVSLPRVERQPLSGFGPLPRRYVVPADREPVVRPFAPDLDALPALALAPPLEPEPRAVEVRALRVEGGVGLHVGRYGRVDLSGAGAAGEFFVDADYDGVSGTNSDLSEDEWVRSDRVAVRAGGRSFAPGRARLEAFGLLDSYTVPLFAGDARRTRRGFGAEAGVEGAGAVAYEATVGFEQGEIAREDVSTSEGRVDVEARLGFADGRVAVDGAGGVAGAGSFGTDVRYGAVGGAVTFGDPDGLRLTLGARGLAYDGAFGTDRRVGPIVEAELPLSPEARAFAQNDPHVAVRSLLDLSAENPYVQGDPFVLPDVVPVDARVGLELRPGAVRARVYAYGLWAPTYLTFAPSGPDFRDTYVEAQAAGLGADLAVATPQGVSASAGVRVLGYGDADGGEIPFYAPLAGRAGLQVPFDRGRGRVGLAAQVESARPVDTTGTEDAPAWGRLSLDARYEVLDPLSVVVRGERLLGEIARWPGYPEPPYTVLFGLRLSR